MSIDLWALPRTRIIGKWLLDALNGTADDEALSDGCRSCVFFGGNGQDVQLEGEVMTH